MKLSVLWDAPLEQWLDVVCGGHSVQISQTENHGAFYNAWNKNLCIVYFMYNV